jgi:hypothetical protein
MKEEEKGPRTSSARPRLPGLSALTLTEDEAKELQRRIDVPASRPPAPARPVPVGDESILRQPAR